MWGKAHYQSLVLCLLLAATGSVAAQGRPRNQPPGEHYAFLVACADYDRKELNPLNYTRNDIASLHQSFLDAGLRQENIVVLHDKRTERRYLPEIRKIKEELDLLLAEMRPQDTLFVGLAGHGVQFQGEKQSFFCPVDASMKDRSTLLSLDDLYKKLERCKARRKMVLIDACRNDPVSSLARSGVAIESVTRPQLQDVPNGIVVLHSCAPGQVSFEDPNLKHGVFFHHVLEGYKGGADGDKDGQVSMEELSGYVTRETQRYARVNLGAAQFPQRRGEFSGEWILRQLSKPVVKIQADQYIPDDTEVFFSVNVEQILNSPAVRERLPAIRAGLQKDNQYQETLKATGFDPLQDISSVLIGAPAANANGQFDRMVIIIHGRLDPARMMASWDKDPANKLHRVNDGAGGQYLIYETNPKDGQKTFMAVVNRTTIVLAMQGNSVVEVLDKEHGRRRTNLKNKHLQLLLDNRFDAKASMWVVMMGSSIKTNGQTLRDMGLRYFVATLNMTTELDIKVISSTDNVQVATSLAVPKEWRNIIHETVLKKSEISGPIIQGSTLYPSGSYLFLKGKVNADVVTGWFGIR